jgi:peroxiredoxin
MDDGLVLARLALGLVFLVAGVAKLLDGPGSRRALTDFGLPAGLVGRLHRALPAAELATAAALQFAATARWGASAALFLLASFVLGLTRALRRGETPDCHCFGQVHSEPASWPTVGRNVALALPAAYVAGFGPGPALISWVDGHTAEGLWLIATSSLAALGAASTAVLLRQNRRLRAAPAHSAPKPVRVGARAPRISLPVVGGDIVRLEDLLVDERPCLVTFVAAACGPCTTLLPEIARWQGVLADRLVIAVVSAGGLDAAGAIADEHGLRTVLADTDAAVSRAYGIPGTPSSVLIDSRGVLRSGPAAGQIAIEALVRVALQGPPEPALAAAPIA